MAAAARVTIVLSRFEDLVNAGLLQLVASDPAIEILAADVAYEQLDRTLARLRPAVAIINFGSLAVAADVHRMHVAHPATRLIVLANRPTAAESGQMLALGATACLAKRVEGRDILTAIHLASRGLHVLPRDDDDRYDAPGPDVLTPRETDVLTHLQQNRSNAEIAHALSVSVETVRTHARSVFRKLGVRTRRDLITRRR